MTQSKWSQVELVGWLVGRLVGWLAGRLAGWFWLVGWFGSDQAGSCGSTQSVNPSQVETGWVARLVGWLAGWLVGLGLSRLGCLYVSIRVSLGWLAGWSVGWVGSVQVGLLSLV